MADNTNPASPVVGEDARDPDTIPIYTRKDMRDALEKAIHGNTTSLASIPTPTAGRAEALEEIGWLAEVPARIHYRPVYYSGGRRRETDFTTDPNEAIRFARKEDAEKSIRTMNLIGCEAREHLWLDGDLSSAPTQAVTVDDAAVERFGRALWNGQPFRDWDILKSLTWPNTEQPETFAEHVSKALTAAFPQRRDN